MLELKMKSDSILEFEGTTEELNIFFIRGLNTLLKDMERVAISPEVLDLPAKKSIDIDDSLYNEVVGLGIINILEEAINEKTCT